MLAEFENHIQENFTELLNAPFLLAVSGGLDSVVLSHLCAKLEMNFAIAHCNFQLRGTASYKDEKSVKVLAKKIDRKIFITNFDTINYSKLNKVSVQVAARDLRYRWFDQLMQEFEYKTLVTGHHSDDNLETFLINLSRGTGLDGLTGIPDKTETISRPLLAFSRKEILDYAKSKKLQWREDESNSNTKYLRNKIRHEVVPCLKELNPTFLQNFELTLGHLKESASKLKKYSNEIKEKLFIEKEGVTRIFINDLNKLAPIEPYLFELFKEYGFTAWKDIARLLTSNSGKEVRSKTHRLIKDRGYLLLQKLVSFEDEFHYISEASHAINLPIKLKITEVEVFEKTDTSNILYVDKKTLKYPLLLRKWHKGDYFYPLGMEGKKKVSKYFKDEKFDKISKEKQWLLFSDNKLLWILGNRADDRFKVTDKTKKILKIKLY